MISGIYILRFLGTNKVYVGQSIDLHSRRQGHLTSLRGGKSARKLQAAYYEYGEPVFEVVLECSELELNTNENLAIEIFDSVNNGFNSLAHAEDMPSWKNKLKGQDNGSSKYSNEQILQVVNLMANPNNSLVYISSTLNVSYDTIKKISEGVLHTWVREQYPELWCAAQSTKALRAKANHVNRAAILSDKFSAKSQGIEYPEVVSPSNITYTISNLSEFCRVHDLQRANFRKVLQGTRQSHKGWRIVK